MNCFELRRHIATGHHIDLRGLDYGELVAIHTQEHEAIQGHEHDADDEEGAG